MTIAIAHLFATPLIVDTLPDMADLDASLSPAIAAQAGGRLAWQGDLPETEQDVARALNRIRDHVVALADAHTEDALSKGVSRFGWMMRTWANSTRPGGTVEPRRCYDAFWIADYFVDDGYGGSSSRDFAGELVIDDPRLPLPMAELPDLRLRTVLDPNAPGYEPEIMVRPGTGRLILYPGWLSIRRRPLAGGKLTTWLSVSLTAERR